MHGINGLLPKRSAYSTQFKQQMLSHREREKLSSRQVTALYDIRNPIIRLWSADAISMETECFRSGARKKGIPT